MPPVGLAELIQSLLRGRSARELDAVLHLAIRARRYSGSSRRVYVAYILPGGLDESTLFLQAGGVGNRLDDSSTRLTSTGRQVVDRPDKPTRPCRVGVCIIRMTIVLRRTCSWDSVAS